MFIKEEAIVLKVSPFEEKAFLIDLFCKESGLIKIFLQSPKPFLQPYCLIDCVLQKGRSDLYYLKEASHIDTLPKIRTPELLELSLRLHAALYGATRDPQIYLLYKAFLEHLHLAKNPRSLLASFCLKLLAHEGLLSLEREEGKTSFAEGEWLHEKEAPLWSLHFNERDVEDLLFLAKSRSLLQIDEKSVSESLLMKVNQIFENAKGGT